MTSLFLNPPLPARRAAYRVLISPMVVPVIIVAVGLCSAFAPLGLTSSYAGMILAHAALGAPFVVITVLATLSGFDPNLLRAAASLGARSEEHTSELQSLMRTSVAVFFLKKKKNNNT